jgi:alkylation response protein AidB-like acyl-CoA dehydrogenase
VDLTYPAETEAFRVRIRQFLADQLPADWAGMGALAVDERDDFAERWRQTLLDNRLLGVTVPCEYGGGGLSHLEQAVLIEEFVRAGVPVLPHRNDNFGFNLLVPTLLQFGTEAQKAYFLPRTLSGEIRWAQGYSEPDAGSDLFNVRTRGDIDGVNLVINGQKVWQTAGLTANWLFTVVRTDPQAARSRGLSFVLISLEQPGVERRGIRDMTGNTELSEVFFTDAVTPVSNVVGGLHNGMVVTLALLGFERGIGGLANAEAFAIELRRLVELARTRGRSQDGNVRLRIAQCYIRIHVLRCVGLRALSLLARGEPPGPESSLTKVLTSEYHKDVTELAIDILGAAGLIRSGPGALEMLKAQPLGLDATSSAAWIDDFLNARARTIYGGSSEIQRNTIGEQILGLPREPRPEPAR